MADKSTLDYILGEEGAYVFDIEADSLTPTKIHCLSLCNVDGTQLLTTSDYDQMRRFFNNAKVVIGHNIKQWDIPNIERLLGITISNKTLDTISLSWYLEPTRAKHGLGEWGEFFGVPKPVVLDHEWDDQSESEEDKLAFKVKMAHRCEEDVKINVKLLHHLLKTLKLLYDENRRAMDSLLSYLDFKIDCVVLQEESRWKLDVELCTSSLVTLSAEKEQKVLALEEVMPQVPKFTIRNKPKVMNKADGTLSAHGQKWLDLLKENHLPQVHEEGVQVIIKYDPPNPNSPNQIKDWLYSLGWKPETLKYDRNKETGEVKKIPQIKKDGEICESVKKLYIKEPGLELIEGLSVLSHRISILKGFLRDVDSEGYLMAAVAGITNTMRFRHRILVNLPGVDRKYGDIIRGCLIAPDDTMVLCGSDMSSLEDRTKQHFIYPYDPNYVREMMVPDFDPHLALAKFAGVMSSEDIALFNKVKKAKEHNQDNSKTNHVYIAPEDLEQYGILAKIRHAYKQVNYSALYRIGVEALARAIGESKAKAKSILSTYWKRNWSVEKFASERKVKTIGKQMWVFNPLSKFWYSLRNEKDIFSTINQGAGTFCFDIWVKEVLSRRKQLTGQFHDEIILTIKKGEEEKIKQILKDSIKAVNVKLKMNRELDVDVQFGDSYKDIH